MLGHVVYTCITVL